MKVLQNDVLNRTGERNLSIDKMLKEVSLEDRLLKVQGLLKTFNVSIENLKSLENELLELEKVSGYLLDRILANSSVLSYTYSSVIRLFTLDDDTIRSEFNSLSEK